MLVQKINSKNKLTQKELQLIENASKEKSYDKIQNNGKIENILYKITQTLVGEYDKKQNTDYQNQNRIKFFSPGILIFMSFFIISICFFLNLIVFVLF